jgi:hypothetical protein
LRKQEHSACNISRSLHITFQKFLPICEKRRKNGQAAAAISSISSFRNIWQRVASKKASALKRPRLLSLRSRWPFAKKRSARDFLLRLKSQK